MLVDLMCTKQHCLVFTVGVAAQFSKSIKVLHDLCKLTAILSFKLLGSEPCTDLVLVVSPKRKTGRVGTGA